MKIQVPRYCAIDELVQEALKLQDIPTNHALQQSLMSGHPMAQVALCSCGQSGTQPSQSRVQSPRVNNFPEQQNLVGSFVRPVCVYAKPLCRIWFQQRVSADIPGVLHSHFSPLKYTHLSTTHPSGMSFYDSLVFSASIDRPSSSELRRWRRNLALRSVRIDWDLPGAPQHLVKCTASQAESLCAMEWPTVDDARMIDPTVESFSSKSAAMFFSRAVVYHDGLVPSLGVVSSSVSRMCLIARGSDKCLQIVQFASCAQTD